MTEFHVNYLAEDWEEDTLRELLSMTRGSGTFWDYVIALQSKNSLLHGTVSHLLEDKLRHQLGAGMETRLSKKVSTEKVNKVPEFRKWLNKVKRCDEGLCAEREEYEKIAKENRDSQCPQQSSEPSSHCIPNNGGGQSTFSGGPVPAPHKQCPKLLDSKHKLLNDNEGCIKCHCVIVDHCVANCPNNFPNPATYRSLTQNNVDRAKPACGRGVAAMTSSNNVNIPTASMTFTEPAPNPVTAVLGMTRNPVAYIAPNALSVIEGTPGSDSDSTNSVSVSTSVPVPQNMKGSMKDMSPLHMPHFYWCCLTSGRVCHGYSNTCGDWVTGSTGMGTVLDFDTPWHTVTRTYGITGTHGYFIVG